MKSKHTSIPTLWVFAAIALLVNMLVLDYLVIRSLSQDEPVLGVTTTSTCPQACVTLINKSKTTTTKTSATKEYYVPMGQGTGSAFDWEDVAGVQAYIDTTNYPKIKQVVVETTISVPTGNQKVWVRFVNSTDGRQAWGSELSMEGSGPTTLTTPAISLDSGNKLYKVQMKTQLGYPAYITQARVHITTY